MSRICFFTSSMLNITMYQGKEYAIPILNINQFYDRLKQVWPTNPKILLVSSSPYDFDTNDYYQSLNKQSLTLSDLNYEKMDILDYRHHYSLNDYEVLILAGGHTPTQNYYFNEINLKQQTETYHGLVITISAGTINSAGIVYIDPITKSEADVPIDKRLLKGLGLLDLRIIPHYQDNTYQQLAIADSYFIDYYGLEDGAYFFNDGKDLYLCGKALYFKDGLAKEIGEDNQMTLI